MFIRTEKSIKDFMYFYPIISALVIINIALYLLVEYIPLPTIDLLNRCELPTYSATLGEQIRSCGLGFNPAVAQGQYWRLVTPIFLHGGLMHVLFNSFSLVLFGPALEQMLGRFKFIIMYLATGIIGNIGTYIIDPDMLNPHLGASGAIYGLFGIYVYMIFFRKDLIDRTSAQIVTVIIIIGLIMSFRPGINVSAHIFGFIGGAMIAPLFLSNARPFSPYRNRPRKPKSDDGIHFNPDRWRRRRKIRQGTIKKIIWTVIGILLLFGVLSFLNII